MSPHLTFSSSISLKKKQEKEQFLSKLFFSLSRMKNRRFNNRNKRKKLLAKNVNA
jgi:hypothetical protein